MQSYDDYKTAPPEDDGPPGDCPVCDGGEGLPCSEECDEAMTAAQGARLARICRRAARNAAGLARLYLEEGGPDDPRIPPVMARVRELRQQAKEATA